MSDVKALDPALLKQYSVDFNADRANLVAANAAVSSGVLAAATDYKGERVLQNDFSIELKQGSITNQRSSGRCWMFAALNTLRYELMHRWNLEDFEFSETYLFFWDAMEKSNTYLENVLATLDEPLDSRVFEAINYGPADDGGWWQMFADLVNKYGLVPKSAYPESANSRNSDAFKQYLNTKLREFASDLRDRHTAGTSLDELRALKNEDMATVYRMCAIALGEPPERFDFLARMSDDKDDAKKKTAGMVRLKRLRRPVRMSVRRFVSSHHSDGVLQEVRAGGRERSGYVVQCAGGKPSVWQAVSYSFFGQCG